MSGQASGVRVNAALARASLVAFALIGSFASARTEDDVLNGLRWPPTVDASPSTDTPQGNLQFGNSLLGLSSPGGGQWSQFQMNPVEPAAPQADVPPAEPDQPPGIQQVINSNARGSIHDDASQAAPYSSVADLSALPPLLLENSAALAGAPTEEPTAPQEGFYGSSPPQSEADTLLTPPPSLLTMGSADSTPPPPPLLWQMPPPGTSTGDRNNPPPAGGETYLTQRGLPSQPTPDVSLADNPSETDNRGTRYPTAQTSGRRAGRPPQVPLRSPLPPGQCSSAHILFGEPMKGKASYYGDTGGTGACSYHLENAFSGGAWSRGITLPTAITSAIWDQGPVCGMCLEFRGTGAGLGVTPLPTSTQYAMVTDECPGGCAGRHLDLAASEDGVWDVEWHPVQCNVGSTPFNYAWQGSNPYYIKLQISNTRVPVATVRWEGRQMQRSMGDGYWVLDSGGPFSLPGRITVTSVLGDEVEDTVPDTAPAHPSFTGLTAGSAQFPNHAEYGTVGSPSDPGPKRSGCGGSASGQQLLSDSDSQPPPQLTNMGDMQPLLGITGRRLRLCGLPLNSKLDITAFMIIAWLALFMDALKRGPATQQTPMTLYRTKCLRKLVIKQHCIQVAEGFAADDYSKDDSPLLSRPRKPQPEIPSV